MKRRVIWRAAAERDLSEVYLHLGAESPEAAERLLDAVEAAVALLLENPEAGQPREFRSPRAQGLRSWMPRDFSSYLIFYRLAGEDIEIVRFLHGARDLPSFFEQT